MHPIVLGVRAYPVAIAVAVAVGVLATVLCARRASLPLRRFVGLQLLLVVAALLGAKLYAVVEQGQMYAFPHSAWSLDAFRYPGGLLATLIALPVLGWLFRVSVLEIADVVAAPVAFAMATVRAGCFLQGCCFGSLTDTVLGVRFPANSPAWNEHLVSQLITMHDRFSLPVHPLQLYFGLCSLLVAIALVVWWPRRQFAGQVFLLLLVLHEGAKAMLEGLRVPARPGFQLVSATVALGAAAALALCTARPTVRSRAVP